jgi:hypothetical protein
MRLPASPILSSLSCLLGLALLSPALVAGQAVPQPFPKPATPGQTTPAPTRPAPGQPASTAPAQPASAEAPPNEAMLGAPVYPSAQFLASYNAGQGQRYYLFGSSASFAEVVNFYRTALRQRGEVIFEEPATHIFEIGRYREETMAFPPSVVVKDYTWGSLGGYLNPKPNTQPARFPTVIQMVPITPEPPTSR